MGPGDRTFHPSYGTGTIRTTSFNGIGFPLFMVVFDGLAEPVVVSSADCYPYIPNRKPFTVIPGGKSCA